MTELLNPLYTQESDEAHNHHSPVASCLHSLDIPTASSQLRQSFMLDSGMMKDSVIFRNNGFAVFVTGAILPWKIQADQNLPAQIWNEPNIVESKHTSGHSV